MSSTKKLVIKPYRQNMGMDVARAQEIWASLRKAIDEIFSHNASLLSFEELYRNAYNLVLHKHGDLLYNGVMSVIAERLDRTAATISAVSDAELLAALHFAWTDHQVVLTMVRDILMYMDRTYVEQKRKLPVYDSGLLLFRDAVARNPSIRDRMRLLLLQAIDRERNGEVIDRTLVKSALQMLVDLGIHSHAVYEDDFERFFLDQTLAFYRAEAQLLLDTATCSAYLEKAEQRLAEESVRVTHYLNFSTESKLKTIVETQLITQSAQALIDMDASGCNAMFVANKQTDLRRMYALFKRVPVTLPLLSASVLQFIETEGARLVAAQTPAATSSIDAPPVLDASAFVAQLLALRQLFVGFLSDCFQDDPQFHKSIKQGFERFMNTSALCAGYLAQFIDELLRSKSRFDQELELRVTNVIALFRYLQDKDVFEEFYKTLLAKRLLATKSSASDEAERLVISKLKAECGYQFTSKLEGMFKDMSISKDLMELYRKEPESPHASLSVQVLTSGFWPTEMAPMCALPIELHRLATTFDAFYCARHNGRKLTWMTNMGTVDVRASFGVEHGPLQRHELNVSTYQAVILLLFNQRTRWRYSDLAATTQIDGMELKRHLISLCTPKYKILVKSSKGKRIDEVTDEFVVHDAYKSKLHRVRVPLVSQKETSLLPAALAGLSGVHNGMAATAVDALPPTVQEDRKHLVEAAIVRIMKTRKQMQHNQLIAEVTRQMTGRFTPTPQLIKLRIEGLIEREYLQRSAADRRLYNYLA